MARPLIHYYKRISDGNSHYIHTGQEDIIKIKHDVTTTNENVVILFNILATDFEMRIHY